MGRVQKGSPRVAASAPRAMRLVHLHVFGSPLASLHLPTRHDALHNGSSNRAGFVSSAPVWHLFYGV